MSKDNKAKICTCGPNVAAKDCMCTTPVNSKQPSVVLAETKKSIDVDGAAKISSSNSSSGVSRNPEPEPRATLFCPGEVGHQAFEPSKFVDLVDQYFLDFLKIFEEYWD